MCTVWILGGVAALVAGCGSGRRDRTVGDAGAVDEGTALDMGAPVAPHPCGSPNTCLDWAAWIGSPSTEVLLGSALPVDDGVVIVGAVKSYDFSGALIGDTTVGSIAGRLKPALFARLDTTGAVVGGDEYDPSDNEDALSDVARLSSGDFIAVGYANVSERETSDHQILAVRVSPSGTQRWLSTYGATAMSSGINFATEYARSVAVSPADEVYAVGKVDSPYPGALGTPGGAIILKLEPVSGRVLWARTFGAGALTKVVASADTVYVVLQAYSGSTVDLGAAGSFPVASSTDFIVALEPRDGAARAAYELAGARSRAVTSLSLDGDGLLFSAYDYTHSPSTGTYYDGGSVEHLDAALGTATVLVSIRSVPDGAVRTAGGELLVSGNGREVSLGEVAFFSVYDSTGRLRFTRVDGPGVGDVTMSSAAFPADERVYLFGSYAQTFQFEALGPRGRSGPSYWAGYVIQATVPP